MTKFLITTENIEDEDFTEWIKKQWFVTKCEKVE